MATLTTADKNKMPSSQFGLPAKKGFPMPDRAHARLALSGAARAANVGNISEAQKERIDAKAHRILGTSKKKLRRYGV